MLRNRKLNHKPNSMEMTVRMGYLRSQLEFPRIRHLADCLASTPSLFWAK